MIDDNIRSLLGGDDVDEVMQEINALASSFKGKSVDEWLNDVDYSGESGYVPSLFAITFVNFMKFVDGTETDRNETPEVHLKVLDSFITNKDRVANLMHRGIGKTTLIEYLFLYLPIFKKLPGLGKVNLAIYVSDSMDNGVASMKKNLEHRWRNSEYLQQMIPERNSEGKIITKFTEDRWQMTSYEGNCFIVKGYGAKSGIRGVKEMGIRPQLAVMDDLVSDEDARSPTALRTIKDTVYRAIEFALDPQRKKVIWCGTPFNAKDPLYEAVESGTWEVNVYPICERFPCSRTEFRGSWEDRFSYKSVLIQYLKAVNDGELASFNQELMLRIMSEEDRIIQEHELQWYNFADIKESLGNFNKYATTDFSVTEKQSADFSFISIWGVNSNMDYYWLDGICKRQTMDKNIDDLFSLANKYSPLMSTGIETSGQQGGFIPWLRKEMIQRNFFFTLASPVGSKTGQAGIRPTKSKLERFNVMVPQIKAGKFYFPLDKLNHPALLELLGEIRLACVGGFKSKNDDGLDTISQLGMMKITAPSSSMAMVKMKDGIWGVVDNGYSNKRNSYIV